jgi:hypothetical protein
MRKMSRKMGKMRKDHDNTLSLIVDNSLKNDNASHYPAEFGNLIYKQFKELPKIKTYVRNDDYRIFYKQSHLPDGEIVYNVNISKENFLLPIKKELESIKNDLSIVRELVSYISESSPDKEDKNFMYEMKEIMDKINNIEKTVAVIEERTKKLDKLDKIEEAINQLRLEIPQDRQNLATKDFVHSEVKGAKLWAVWTFITAIIGIGGLLIRIFTQ